MGHAPPNDADAFNALEAEGWERRVDAYDRFFTAITARLFEPLLDAVGVAPGTRLLDVASGPGHLAARAAERGAVAVGVDVAHAMIRRAASSRTGCLARFRPTTRRCSTPTSVANTKRRLTGSG